MKETFRMMHNASQKLFFAAAIALLTGVTFPGLPSASPENPAIAFRETVAICEKPGIAPGNWLGDLRAMGWREPSADQIDAVLSNLAEAEVLAAIAEQGFAPPPEGFLERRKRFVTELYQTRQAHGLNEVYVLGQDTDRILRIGTERHFAGDVMMTEPIGGYCNVTFFGESAVREALPNNTTEFPVPGVTLLLGGGDLLQSPMFFDPEQSGATTKPILVWSRISQGHLDPECFLEIANARTTQVFDIPECARRMD